LVAGGIDGTLVPLLTGFLIGRHVFELAAVQEKSESSIATLGYSNTAAIGHILLTTQGSIIMFLLPWGRWLMGAPRRSTLQHKPGIEAKWSPPCRAKN